MNKKPTWVIFDVGQVLYDYKSFMRNVSVLLNIELLVLDNAMKEITQNSLKGEMTFDEVWKTILKFNQKEHEFENILKLWWDKKTFVEDTKLLLHQLHDRGYAIALFSNNWPGMRNKILKNISEKNIIEHFFESSVEHLRKPDIKFYNLVEERTGARADEIYFIDDQEKNLESAKVLGWKTFLYKIGEDKGKSSNDLIRKELL